ncbi:hypothetical protein V8F20_007747, partial [Naviculisporaceae sp. PSN 640]
FFFILHDFGLLFYMFFFFFLFFNRNSSPFLVITGCCFACDARQTGQSLPERYPIHTIPYIHTTSDRGMPGPDTIRAWVFLLSISLMLFPSLVFSDFLSTFIRSNRRIRPLSHSCHSSMLGWLSAWKSVGEVYIWSFDIFPINYHPCRRRWYERKIVRYSK